MFTDWKADARKHAVQASIEVSPKQAAESAELPGLFPTGTRVYVTDLGSDSDATLVRAAKRLADLGYRPVPHFAARRLTIRAALEDRMRAMAEEAGVRDILVIGGGPHKPAGDFKSAMDVLETGLADRYGITEIGVAGHPEGGPDFDAETAIATLRIKQMFADRTGARMRIVTQFGFDGGAFVRWAEGLSALGVDLPVHVGVAGPAKLTTLIKFAAACGVGNSLDFLRKRAGSLAMLAASQTPEDVVGPIERQILARPTSAIAQIHVFPFGGIRKASEWLVARGSWAKSALEGRSHR